MVDMNKDKKDPRLNNLISIINNTKIPDEFKFFQVQQEDYALYKNKMYNESKAKQYKHVMDFECERIEADLDFFNYMVSKNKSPTFWKNKVHGYVLAFMPTGEEE